MLPLTGASVETIPGLGSGMLHIPGSKQFRGARDGTTPLLATCFLAPLPRRDSARLGWSIRAHANSLIHIVGQSDRATVRSNQGPPVRRERTGYPARVAYVWSSFLISSTRRHHTNHQTMNHPCRENNSYIASRLIKHHRRRWHSC
jgi:hypothetical protein